MKAQFHRSLRAAALTVVLALTPMAALAQEAPETADGPVTVGANLNISPAPRRRVRASTART